MSTPAQRAALRIIGSLPPEAIHTHHQREPIRPDHGGSRTSRERAAKLRAWLAEHKDTMTYAEMAKALDVPKYVVNNYLRVIRGYKWTGKRKK